MRFRLLTYNIHRAIGLDRQFAPERIVEVIGHHAADIVLLQEVDRGAPRSERLDLAHHLARMLGYRYRAVGMNVFLKEGKYGNATLSRFPIDRQRNIDLTIGDAKRRGAQHTRVHVARGGHHVTINIFNIHLSLLARLRRFQMRRLLATPDITELGSAAACIVAGDMNDWRGRLGGPFLEPAGFVCATNRQPGSRRAIRTFPSIAPAGGLDKIYYRGALRLVQTVRSELPVARVASDHLPLIADFELLSGVEEAGAVNGKIVGGVEERRWTRS